MSNFTGRILLQIQAKRERPPFTATFPTLRKQAHNRVITGEEQVRNSVAYSRVDREVRFHGTKRWYRHDYTKEELAVWAERIRQCKPVHAWIYFNNDRDGYAKKMPRSFCGYQDLYKTHRLKSYKKFI